MSGKCGKQRFRQRAAERALLDAQIARSLRGSSRRRECRAYECPVCGWWHLTSRPGLSERKAS